jgi:hypothetical protein
MQHMVIHVQHIQPQFNIVLQFCKTFLTCKELTCSNSLVRVVQGATALTEIKLSRNQLSGALSPAVSALCRFKTLDLCQNRLTTIPGELGQCTALVEINLGFNRLVSLPQELGQLAALQTLDVRNNLYACLTRSMLAFGCTRDRLWMPETFCMPAGHAVCWHLGVQDPDLGCLRPPVCLRSMQCVGN